MYKFSLFLVLCYAAVLGWGNAIDYKCTPNETFQDDCNTCICGSDGKSAACTLISCLKHSTESDLPEVSTSTSDIQLSPGTTETSHSENQTKPIEGNVEHIENNNNHVCTPNDVKMQDCNRCRCAANGIGWFCTRRLCPTDRSNGHQKRSVQSPRSTCKPGEKWNDGCNDCFCTKNGFVACTEMFCFEPNTKILLKRNLPDQECTPGTTWRKDCNSCFCTDTGFAACTLKGCLKNNIHHISTSNLRIVSLQEFSDPTFSCLPSESFKLECNTCKCSVDGKGATWCTKKRCVDEDID